MTDLTDGEWEAIKALTEAPQSKGGRWSDHRQVINALLWRASELSAGRRVTWRMIPARYGPWQTIHRRFNQWNKDQTLDTIFYAIRRYHKELAKANASRQNPTQQQIQKVIQQINMIRSTQTEKTGIREASLEFFDGVNTQLIWPDSNILSQIDFGHDAESS